MKPPSHVLDAHGKHAQRALFTRDGSLLVTCGQDARVRLWEVPGFAPAGVFEGHGASVNTLSLSPDESLLATGSSDGTVRVFSFPGGRELAVLHGNVWGAFAPAGERLATISTKSRVVLFDANYDEVATMPLLDRRLFCLAFSRDGSEVFAGGQGTVHRVDVAARAKGKELPGHTGAVVALAAAPGEDSLASTGAEGALRVRAVRDGAERFRVALGRSGTYQIAWSADGGRLAVSLDFAIQVRSAVDGGLLDSAELPIKGVYGVAFSPDGRWLANAGADGRVRVFDLS